MKGKSEFQCWRSVSVQAENGTSVDNNSWYAMEDIVTEKLSKLGGMYGGRALTK